MPHLTILSINRDPCGRPGDPASGGQVKYIYSLIKHLSGLGWSIDIFTTQWIYPESETQITDGVVVHRTLLQKKISNYSELSVDDCWDVGEKIKDRLRDIPDISLSCSWQSVPSGLILKRSLGVPAVVTFCSLGYFKLEHLRRQGEGEPAAFQKRMELEALAAAEMDAIIALTPTEKDILRLHYNTSPRKIHIIPRGIDFELFHANPVTLSCEA